MLEFLRDYLVYFWNLLFRRNTPPSGALTNAEVDKILAEAKTEKEPIEKPEPIKAESAQAEPTVRDQSPAKTAEVTSDNPNEHHEKPEPDSLLPSVQTRPIPIRQPTSRSIPTGEPDEHVLKSSIQFEKANEEKRDSFIEFERLQQSKEKEAVKLPIHKESKEEADTIEDEKIVSIVEDILNYEENLPEESEEYIEVDLQKKIREHLKALQEQENQFQHEESSQVRKPTEPTPSQAQQQKSVTKQLKYASEEEFEDNIAVKMAANEENSNALVSFPVDVPQLPDLKGKTGGATIKASEEDSKEIETHKTVTKNEGDKKLEQTSHKLQKQDSAKTAQASIKTTNEGGVRRTVQSTQVTFSSSFEEEETTQQKITSGPIKSIVMK